ncbi:MAG: hypothetical protein IJP25_04655 [Elusimicrobiaceae bacterium]|uniref:Porin n=1 Tax=Candidatus Avelusimicrobium gallicola TaxID=2562704 RepID=A0A928HJ49_9BACT|nr:hypothetical protein [Elusimicrobium sp.]MBQ9971392.1 hypothetical protein [Elusimicrobiaceae bacterium]
MKKLAVLLAFVLCAAPAFAESGIVKLSLWGKRLAIAAPANTQHITGLELGIGSDTDYLAGVQLDYVYGKAGEVKGVQSALLSRSNKLTGAQLAAINLSEGYLKGAQLGFYNQAESLTGVQLGFVNNVKNIHGLQIGLVNIAKNGWFPVMVLVNGRF